MLRIPEPSQAPGGSRVPRTVEAYLTTDLEALAEGGLLLHEQEALQALCDEVRRRHAPAVVTGTQLFAELEACRLLETGCTSIDSELLRGGMRGGQMVEVCGESASGKTQLCLSAAARAARSTQRVVYIDTSNAVSGRRLAQVVLAQQQRQLAAGQEAGQQETGQQEAGQRQQAGVAPQALPSPMGPLRFVEVRRCYDVHSLLRVLDELMQQAQAQAQSEAQAGQQSNIGQQAGQQSDVGQQWQDPGGQQAQQGQQGQQGQQPGTVRKRLDELPVRLLVVDCLSALITPILGGGQHNQGHALLAATASSLKAFAARSGAAVLVTVHMVGGGDDRRHEKRPAMGESWRNQPHVRIQLSKPPADGLSQQCTATLTASPQLPPGLSVAYWLGDGGPTAMAPQSEEHAAEGAAEQAAQPMQK